MITMCSDHLSLHGSSDVIQPLPGTTEDVNIDLEVSFVQLFKGLQRCHTFSRIWTKTEFWHFSQYCTFVYFQFSDNWPSHIFSFTVFHRRVPIPIDWLQTRNIEKSYHPHCSCPLPPSGSSQRSSCLDLL